MVCVREPKWEYKLCSIIYKCGSCEFEVEAAFKETHVPALGVCRCGGLLRIHYVSYVTVGEEPLPQADINQGFKPTDEDAEAFRTLGIKEGDESNGNEDDDLQWN